MNDHGITPDVFSSSAKLRHVLEQKVFFSSGDSSVSLAQKKGDCPLLPLSDSLF